MTSSFRRILVDSQPAIFMAAALAFVCSNDAWPVAAAVFLGLQLTTMALALRKQRACHEQDGVRFFGRAMAAPQEASRPLIRRTRLHLVP